MKELPNMTDKTRDAFEAHLFLQWWASHEVDRRNSMIRDAFHDREKLLELVRAAFNAGLAAAAPEADRMPHGWLYGNSFWHRDNPRITEDVMKNGKPLYE